MRSVRVMTGMFCGAVAMVTAGAQIGVYGTFSTTQLQSASVPRIEGVSFGAYDDKVHLPLVNLGIDLRGAVFGGSAGTRVQSGVIGPRVVAHLPIVPLRPYLEGLVGAGHVQEGRGVTYNNATALDGALAAGLDLTFFPRLDWRVVDYQFGVFHGLAGNTKHQTISTGLVFRLPIP